MEQLIAAEGQFLLWIQEHVRVPALTPFMKAVTTMGNKGLVWIILTLILLIIKRTRMAGICCMLALLIMVVCNNLIIKNLVNRTRPYNVIEELEIIVEEPDDSSFPSGHTAAGFATSMALILGLPMVMDRKKGRLLGILAMIFAALIGYSRLYVGVHFPTDVLGGAILGVLYGIAGYYLGKKLIGVIERKWPHVFPTAPAAGTQGSGPKAGA